MHNYGYMNYGAVGGFGFFDLIWHAISIILLILLVVWVLRMFGMGGRRHRRWMGMHSAIGILDQRFVKGEIQKEEYEEKKKALMN